MSNKSCARASWLHTYYFKTTSIPSLSTMVTVANPGLPRVTPEGSELWSIVRVNSSLLSSMVSLLIGTSNVIVVTPAGNVTVYGPES